jgi:membrane protein DedA with SNARE-associated domain
MENATKILTEHPYASLFLAVFAEQIGLPFPALVFLTAAGALSAAGHGRPGAFLLAGVAATLIADLIWFSIGKCRGRFVVKLVSWLSPKPDGYARRAWDAFRGRGERILLWAKFVPNLSTFTTPLAGAAKMPLSRFLVFNGIGTVLWNGAYLAAGWVLGPEIGRVAHAAARLGAAPFVILFAAIATAVLWSRLRPRAAEPAMVRIDARSR